MLLLGLVSCKKSDTPEPVPAGGTWTINGNKFSSDYSEIQSRNGFQLNFADNSGVNNISFLFRSRPGAAGTFNAASDTSKAVNVYVHLETNGIAYHSATSGGGVTIEMADGKLFIRGSRIRMSADSTSDTDADLDFSLREY